MNVWTDKSATVSFHFSVAGSRTENVTVYLFVFSLQNAVIVALSSKSWDVETATELLLSNWTM